MRIVYKKIDELIPYENNPRHNDQAVDAVAESIREFGFRNPIIIDKDNVIVAGHTRQKAAKQLGMTEVPCVMAADLTDEQVRAFRIADNKTTEIAEWDYDLLRTELAALDDMFTGFDSQEIDDLLADMLEPEEDEYEPDTSEEPKAKLGDIYQLGQHWLMCGDSTDMGQVNKLLKGVKIDLAVTDPPYNVDYERGIENDNLAEADFERFLEQAFYNLAEALKAGGAFYIWHAHVTAYLFEKALRKVGLLTRQQLIWNKDRAVLSRQDYHWKHEPCLYGWKEGAAHYYIDDRKQRTVIEDHIPNYRNMSKDEMIELLDELYADRISTTVISERRPGASQEHPMMKPIKLLARLIRNSSRANESVLDLFGGSGSTLIACEQLNRRCYMMELDPQYVDVIIDRWEKYTGEKAVKA